jgi:hypothetical protein
MAARREDTGCFPSKSIALLNLRGQGRSGNMAMMATRLRELER